MGTLVGRTHVGIIAIIKEIRKEQNIVENEIERALRGEPAPKMRRDDNQREIRIQNVTRDRDKKAVLEYLRGIAHNISI